MAVALLPAQLAWYATGRFYKSEDGKLADYGYFLHLPFVPGPMFEGDGPPSETTAHFTFAAHPFTACGATNGDLSLGLDPEGRFSLHVQHKPAGNFGDPHSFGHGKRIAVFRRTSLVVGTTVGSIVGTNVFSAHLIESTPFEFAGHQYDLANHMGFGVTQFGTASETPVMPPPNGYTLVLPFTGSAIALGEVA